MTVSGWRSPASAYSKRFGVPAPRPLSTSAVARPVRASATAAGVAPGWRPSTSAAAPATCGVAIEVPLSVAVALSLPAPAEGMFTPGARRSTQAPSLENAARASVGPVAPTVRAAGAAAGEYWQASAWSLPAATTTVRPAATAVATASLSTGDR